MSEETARARRQTRTRAAIVQAAEAIITTQGPETLTMRTVAAHIDYSVSALYEYFASKDEVLDAVVHEALTRLIGHVSHLTTGQSARERLLAYGQAYLDFARTHPHLYRLIFGREDLPLPTSTDKEPLYGLLHQIVQAGIATGDFAPHPGFGEEEMTFGCWSLVHGIAMLRLTLHERTWDAPRDGDAQILRAFIAGLG